MSSSSVLHVRPLYSQEDYGEPISLDKASSFNAYLGYYALGATILFTLLVFTFEVYLDFRQKSSYQKTGMFMDSFPQCYLYICFQKI